MEKKVWLTQDVDCVPEGTCVHIYKETKVYYYGSYSSHGCTDGIKAPKKYCTTVNPMQYITDHFNKIEKEKKENTIKLTIVDFTGGGDGVFALYKNGVRRNYGDYYHTKIEDWIHGYIEGVKDAGFTVEEETIKILDEQMISNISEMGEVPPENLDEIKIKNF